LTDQFLLRNNFWYEKHKLFLTNPIHPVIHTTHVTAKRRLFSELFYLHCSHKFLLNPLSPNVNDLVVTEVEVNLRTTVSRHVCLGAVIPSGSHDQISFIFLRISGFLIWDTLFDERMCL
jgi:hypothetical protein